MKKKYSLLLALILAVTLFVFPNTTFATQKEGNWISRASMPTDTGREGFGSQALNGEIYTFSGHPNSSVAEKYDVASNTWSSFASIPTGRIRFASAVFEDKIYAFGGWKSTWGVSGPNFSDYEIAVVTGATEVYDASSDTWETKTSMPTPRYCLQANMVDGKIYLIGGLTQQDLTYPLKEHSSNATEVYNPTADSWATMAPIPTPVWGYTSAVVDGKIYVISGWTGNSSMLSGQSASLCTLVQIFNPQTNQWTLGTPIPQPVVLAAGAATTGEMAPKRVYVVGGSLVANLQDYQVTETSAGRILTLPISGAVQIYNQENDSWNSGVSMRTARYDLGVAVVADRLYALGGSGDSLVNVNEVYTPDGYGPQPSVSPTPSTTAATINPNNKTHDTQQQTLPLIIVAMSVVVLAGLVIYFKKHSKPNHKMPATA